MSFPSERGSLELCLGSFLELVHRLIYLLASILHVAGGHDHEFNDMYLCGGMIMDLPDIPPTFVGPEVHRVLRASPVSLAPVSASFIVPYLPVTRLCKVSHESVTTDRVRISTDSLTLCVSEQQSCQLTWHGAILFRNYP